MLFKNPFVIALLFLFSVILFLPACQEVQPNEFSQGRSSGDEKLFYHYSIWYAFVNKVFEGDLTVKELKEKGDVGLGSYNLLDGELVMLDGVPYQITEDAQVKVPDDTTKIVYVNAAFFHKDTSFSVSQVNNYDSLRNRLNEQLPTKNYFYAFKIHGTFQNLKCGGLHRQERPFAKGLDVLIPARPVFEKESVTGTMVGFYCPEFIGQINVAGYHLHFISDDKQFGGHVMEFSGGQKLDVALSKLTRYQFELPETPDYEKVSMDKTFQYNKK